MSSFTPPSKRNKTSTPHSESKSIIVLDDDDQRFESVIRASRSPLYLSPLGKKIVKESIKSAKPLNLEDVNKEVLMKEFARQLGQHSDSEEEEDDNKEEEAEEDNDKNSGGKSDDEEESEEEEESKKKPTATTKIPKKKAGRAGKKKISDNPNDGNNEENDDDNSGSVSDRSEKSSSSDSICVKKSFIKTINKDTKICLSCGLVPCERENYEEIIEKEGLDKAKECDGHNKAIRHHLYKFYIAAKYGKLGKANRVRIPLCVEEFIRSLYPDPMGNYIGFRESLADPDQSDDEKSDYLGSSVDEDEM